MDQFAGILLYLVSLLTMGGIYALLALALNIQWGFTGIFNAGIAGFLAIGAYVSAILTTAPSLRHLGGFEYPLVVGAIAAMAGAAVIAWAVGRICIRLRADYLAIATIGIGEILRLVLKNESWATNGPRGISKIPKAFEGVGQPASALLFAGLVLLVVLLVYLALERARTSPWGRVMMAIRDDEEAARAAGKNVNRLRMEAFVIGAALMGLAGAFLAQYLKFIGINATDPVQATFLVWVMLIIGGSGNNRGAIAGAFLLWAIWSLTGWLASQLPDELAIRGAYLRIFLIGLLLQFMLQYRPQGLLPEKRPVSCPSGKTDSS